MTLITIVPEVKASPYIWHILSPLDPKHLKLPARKQHAQAGTCLAMAQTCRALHFDKSNNPGACGEQVLQLHLQLPFGISSGKLYSLLVVPFGKADSSHICRELQHCVARSSRAFQSEWAPGRTGARLSEDPLSLCH